MIKTIERESWASTTQQERHDCEIGWQRRDVIESELVKIFPNDVNARFYLETSLKNFIRMWITIQPTYDEDNKKIEPDPLETSALKMMAAAYTSMPGEKNLRKETGTIYWRYSYKRTDEHGEFEFWLMIENAHPMTCKITKVTKEVEQFEMDCVEH